MGAQSFLASLGSFYITNTFKNFLTNITLPQAVQTFSISFAI